MSNAKNVSNENLHLYKAHDFCATKKPVLTAIFIHGISSDATSFGSALKYMEDLERLKGIRFVAFDLLGSGQSPKNDNELNYGLNEQLLALEKSIKSLNIKTPIMLVGHSMGTIIATRYADTHRREIDELVLISPPIYRPEDFKNPLFKESMDDFRKLVIHNDSSFADDKAFNNELKYIVSNPHNYEVLASLKKPITIIYGGLDQIIASFNIPRLLKENSMITAHKIADSRHSVSHDKFERLAATLENKLSNLAKEAV